MKVANNAVKVKRTKKVLINNDKQVDESKMVHYARGELLRAGFLGAADKLDAEVGENTLMLIKCLALSPNELGQSATVELFKRLVNLRPLTAIEDVPEEWEDISENSDGSLLRHVRCATICKNEKEAFNLEGLLLVYPDGTRHFHESKSLVPVKFPYVVKEPVLTHVDKDGNFYS